MFNLLIAFAVALVTYGLSSWLFGSAIVGLLPAILVFILLFVLLARRTAGQITAAIEPVAAIMQQGQVAEAEQLLRTIQQRYAWWQLLLTRQIDAQLGLLRYMQRRFDEAEPLLTSGKWRNWTALVCLGAIAYRRNHFDQAWAYCKQASQASPKEAMVYVVWATLLAKQGSQPEALQVLAQGLTALPDNQVLKGLRNTIANKRRINTDKLPQNWGLFFPEDLVKRQSMRGRRGPPQKPPPGMAVRMQQPLPQPRISKKDRRGR